MTHDKAREHYQGSAGLEYHRGKRAIPEQAVRWVARLRAGKLAPLILPGDTVLEYGVGAGWNLAALPCARKIGLDVSEFLRPEVERLGIQFTTNSASIATGSIDAVVCHHTLEHAWQPVDVLAECARMLRPEGRFLLFVPYEKERRFRRFIPAEPNHHLYSWNVQSLGNLVTDAGFKVKSAGLGAFGQERFAAIWASRCRLGEGGFRLLRWVANTLKQEVEVRIVANR